MTVDVVVDIAVAVIVAVVDEDVDVWITGDKDPAASEKIIARGTTDPGYWLYILRKSLYLYNTSLGAK